MIDRVGVCRSVSLKREQRLSPKLGAVAGVVRRLETPSVMRAKGAHATSPQSRGHWWRQEALALASLTCNASGGSGVMEGGYRLREDLIRGAAESEDAPCMAPNVFVPARMTGRARGIH